MLLFEIAAILCIGLLIGTEFAVSAFINPVLQQLEESARSASVRLFATRLGRAMPFWYVLSFLFLLAADFLYHRRLSMLIAATAIWATVILITVLVLVPINNRMMRLPAGEFSLEARQAHRRWNTLHGFRVAALCISFICFLAAVLI